MGGPATGTTPDLNATSPKTASGITSQPSAMTDSGVNPFGSFAQPNLSASAYQAPGMLPTPNAGSILSGMNVPAPTSVSLPGSSAANTFAYGDMGSKGSSGIQSSSTSPDVGGSM